MSNNLVSSFDPFEKPYPDMDMDSEAQDAIEERDNGNIADCDVVDYGRRVLEGYANPTEKGRCPYSQSITFDQRSDRKVLCGNSLRCRFSFLAHLWRDPPCGFALMRGVPFSELAAGTALLASAAALYTLTCTQYSIFLWI